MLKTTSAVPSADALLARAQQFKELHGQQISQQANTRKRAGAGQIEARFLHNISFSDALKRETAVEHPEISSGTTRTGGKWYRANFEFIIQKMSACDIFKPVYDEHNAIVGYDVVCSIEFPSGASDKLAKPANRDAFCVAENLSSTRAFVERVARALKEQDTDTLARVNPDVLRLTREFIDEHFNVRSEVTRRISVTETLKGSLFAFAETDFAVLKSNKPGTQVPQVSFFTPIVLNDASSQIYLSMYLSTPKRKNPDTGVMEDDPEQKPFVRFGRPEIKFTCKGIQCQLGASHVSTTTPSEIAHKMFRKDESLCVPFLDVLNGDVFPQKNAYIWAPGVDFATSAMVRCPVHSNAVETYVTNLNASDKVSKNMWVRNYIDSYVDASDAQKLHTFSLTLKAYEEQCLQINVDHRLWGPLMAAHPFDMHVLATYSERNTLEKLPNQRAALEERPEGAPEGFFEYTVQQFIPDWESTLAREAIPISKETFVADFADAAAALKRDQKRYRIVTVDGVDEVQFIADPFGRALPVHDPEHTKVLNFGAKGSPMLSIGDATPILEAPGARFYALTSMSEAPAANTKDGDAQFKRQASEGAVYQLFVIQSFEESKKSEGKKKSSGKKKGKK